MMIPSEVNNYIQQWLNGKVKFNKERIMLVEHLNKHVLNRDDIYFDESHIANCIA